MVNQELVAATARADRLANRMYLLGDSITLTVLETLEVWKQIAETPGHHAQLAARSQLMRWSDVMTAARSIRTGIVVANTRPEDDNGGSQRR